DRYDVIWRTPLLSGMPLPVVLTFPEGVQTITGPGVQEMPGSTIERRVIEARDGLAGKRIDFVGLQATITDILVRTAIDGRTATTMVRPSRPWITIELERGTPAVAAAYLRHGVEHILFGIDHLLFIASLMLIVRGWRMLVKTI